MKMKMKIAFGVAGSLITTLAMAQSSVTLYGIVDEGIDYTNNAGTGSAWKMQSGDALSSRWGVKGTEDLGGGLQAIFNLENGFDASSGALSQPDRMFGRQAFVGVTSSTFGTVTMGRQYDSVVDFVAPLTANGNWGGYLFSHPLDNDNTDDTFRIGNSVKYLSPSFAGISFGGVYGFSNQAGAFAANRAYSFGAQYSGGPLTIAAAYMQINNPGTNATGAVPSDDGNFAADRLRVWAAGVNYALTEAATVGFTYSHTDLRNPLGSAYRGNFTVVPSSLKFDNYEVNAKYQFTPSLFVGVMYTFTHSKLSVAMGDSSPTWHQAGLMADYNLSKRTDVYTQVVFQNRSGDASGTMLDNAYITGSAGQSSTNKQVVARVALRHSF